MSDAELFPEVQESLSPRLKWMREHNVSVHLNKNVDQECEPYEAYIGKYDDAVDDIAENGDFATKIAYADTEDDAIQKLADINKWQMWWEKERPVWE